MARSIDDYVTLALEAFEAGFTTKSAQKTALDYVTRAFDLVVDQVCNAILAEANELFPNEGMDRARWAERDVFINSRGYWELPRYPHLLRDKHEDYFGAYWDVAVRLRDLRDAIKGAPIQAIIRPAPTVYEVKAKELLSDLIERRKTQYLNAIELGEVFGGLPVAANTHVVYNQFGHRYFRTFWYLHGTLTPLNVIITAAQELERRAEGVAA